MAKYLFPKADVVRRLLNYFLIGIKIRRIF